MCTIILVKTNVLVTYTCYGRKMNDITVDKMLRPLATMLLSSIGHVQEVTSWLQRSGSRQCEELPVPDRDGEVSWGALAGPDDEETNLFAHE